MKTFPKKRVEALVEELHALVVDADCCMDNAAMLEGFDCQDRADESLSMGEAAELRAKRVAGILIKIFSRV